MQIKPDTNVFFSIGYVENYKEKQAQWKEELSQLVGRDLTDKDFEKLENYCREQCESESSIFYDSRWNITSSENADMLLLHTGLSFKDTNCEILVQYKKGRKMGNWMGFEFVQFHKRYSLFDFAYFPPKQDNLLWTDVLAKKAAPEPWTLKTSNEPNDILYNFIKYSFERLYADGQVVESPDHAAFHTGLYTSSYDPIFAYFVLNRNPEKQKWYWKDFCCPNEGSLGKEMSRMLDLSHAKPVRWFKDPARLYCNPDLLMPGVLDINLEHCVIDNAYRLPRKILRIAAFDDKKVIEVLDADYGGDEKEEQEIIANAIRKSNDYANIKEALKGQVENAIQLACRKIQCDYAAAVPQFYPDHGIDNDGFGHLIPLSFNKNDIESVDCALVVQATADGKGYRAATILSPDMAYSDARLLRKPDAHWLTKQLKISTSNA